MHTSKTRAYACLSVCLLIIILFGACTQSQLTEIPTSTVDVQSTIDYAIAATATMEAVNTNIIATAVAATQTAQPNPTATPIPPQAETSDPEPAPETPTDVYVTMTEEELAALIDASVNDAVQATQAASDVSGAVAVDETVTQEEAGELEAVIAEAEDAIELAEELMWVYAELYGEVAQETLALIDELELVLAATADLLLVMVDILEDVNYALEAGIALTEEIIAALRDASQQAGDYAATLDQQSQSWQQTVQSELTRRVNQVLGLVPADVASTRVEALQDAADYIVTAREVLLDKMLTQAELNELAQSGADAAAGLQAQGGVLMKNLADEINAITTAFARGELPDIQGKLSELESMLPSHP